MTEADWNRMMTEAARSAHEAEAKRFASNPEMKDRLDALLAEAREMLADDSMPYTGRLAEVMGMTAIGISMLTSSTPTEVLYRSARTSAIAALDAFLGRHLGD